MNEKLREQGKKFGHFLRSMPPDEREDANRVNFERTQAEHEEFRIKFEQGICYLCDMPLTSFDRKFPCAHWLLKPLNFRKGDFPAIVGRYGAYQLQSFLRWVANQDGFARNINDFREEGSGKLIETTIKYKQFEWAFSCSESDYLGHVNAQHARHPHYHFQMRVNGGAFIKYSDHHIALNDIDIISIEAKRSSPVPVKSRFLFGEGMDDVLSDENAEHIVKIAGSEGDVDEAPFKIDTFVFADEGATISGDALNDLIQEAKLRA